MSPAADGVRAPGDGRPGRVRRSAAAARPASPADTLDPVTLPATQAPGDPSSSPSPDLTTPRPVPWGGVVGHLRASERLHAAVPAPLAMAALDGWQRALAAVRPARLAAARAAMDAVVGGTPREGEVDALALRSLSAAARSWESMWRPRSLIEMPVHGLEHLTGIESGRGVVLSMPHYGPLVGVAPLPRLVGPLLAAVGEQMVAETLPPGYHGHQIEQGRRVMTLSGIELVRASGSARAFAAALEQGGRIVLNFDVPGRSEVQFLGKTVELANGCTRLAEKTGAVVVPVVLRARGAGWYLHVDEPVDPAQLGGWEPALQVVADVHSRLVLEAPEYLEPPNRLSGWPDATRHGWRVRR